jgi:hypothetical protein
MPVLTLSIATILMSLLGIAAHLEGWHSTPGILLAVLNLPGALCMAWINGWPGFVIAILANWGLYHLIAKLFASMKNVQI